MANDIDEAAVHVLVQYLDPDARKGLTKLSRVGRDCVLISSPNAKLRFSLAEGVSPAAANAVRAGLLVRGQFNTALLLECGHSPVSADISAQISALAECLQGASEGIREVELRGTSAARPTPTCTAAQLMQRVVLPALPHITTLTLTHFPCSLPALAQLSQLRKVSFSLPTQPADPPANDHQIASLAAFLSQVTSLELHNCSAPAACSVFSQAPITHTLTHFATDAPLTDELARLLVDKAPALKDLCVREVALTTGELRDSQWVVERLTVTRLGAFPQSLATLPRSTADEFVLSSDELMICSEVSCIALMQTRIVLAKVRTHRSTAPWLQRAAQRAAGCEPYMASHHVPRATCSVRLCAFSCRVVQRSRPSACSAGISMFVQSWCETSAPRCRSCCSACGSKTVPQSPFTTAPPTSPTHRGSRPC